MAIHCAECSLDLARTAQAAAAFEDLTARLDAAVEAQDWPLANALIEAIEPACESISDAFALDGAGVNRGQRYSVASAPFGAKTWLRRLLSEHGPAAERQEY